MHLLSEYNTFLIQAIYGAESGILALISKEVLNELYNYVNSSTGKRLCRRMHSICSTNTPDIQNAKRFVLLMDYDIEIQTVYETLADITQHAQIVAIVGKAFADVKRYGL